MSKWVSLTILNAVEGLIEIPKDLHWRAQTVDATSPRRF